MRQGRQKGIAMGDEREGGGITKGGWFRQERGGRVPVREGEARGTDTGTRRHRVGGLCGKSAGFPCSTHDDTRNNNSRGDPFRRESAPRIRCVSRDVVCSGCTVVVLLVVAQGGRISGDENLRWSAEVAASTVPVLVAFQGRRSFRQRGSFLSLGITRPD